MDLKINFYKYHGLGNDFLLINSPLPAEPAASWLTPQAIVRMCVRHEGIGADGVLVREDSRAADHRMVLFNADGSPAEISGNGLRCFARFVRRIGIQPSDEMTVETGGGIQKVQLHEDGSVITTMPLPDFAEKGVPEPLELTAKGERFTVLPVTVGNPHGVVFGPVRDVRFACAYGPVLERDSAFTEGANIEFATAESPTSCRLVVWERGAGITLACGSGSVAAACAGAALDHFDFDKPIAVHQPGGTLEITVAKGFREILQQGPAEFIFTGEIDI